MSRFILASQSPRRQDLLKSVGLDFEIIISSSDEKYPNTLPIQEVPAFIAKNKAKAVAEILASNESFNNNTCIIAADTVVILENTIMGKPLDKNDAILSLKKLSGKTHEVITGVCVAYQQEIILFSETTKVKFHSLTDDQILYYVEHCKPYDKAGGYAIQEWIGLIGIDRIEGDFYNVMGLPVSKLMQKLKQLALLD
jgi:septum formation protein